MANNRMWIVFRPSGDAVYLGKRLAWGWYDVPANLSERLIKLYEKVENQSENQDDFAIVQEEPPSKSLVGDSAMVKHSIGGT